MTVLIKIVQVILALSILILIHELGHFTFAKMFGIRVDKFFLFFDVKGVKLLSTKTGWFSRLFPSLANKDTEYGIGWLPLGGYCKINGMIDESMDTEFMNSEPKPYEFRSKSAPKRFLVMVGGVLNNFLFAILLNIIILAAWGQSYLKNSENQIYVNKLSYDMGFRTGDRVLAFDDYVPENFGMLQADLVRKNVRQATVLRDGDTVSFYIDQSLYPEVINTPDVFSVAVPFVVDTIPPQSPNYGSGLQRGDRIVEVDGHPIRFVQDSRAVVGEHRNETLPIKALRGADTLDFGMKVDSTGMALIYAQIPGISVHTYSFVQAIPAGLKYTWTSVKGYLSDLKMVATPSTGAYKSVGSFIAIGQVFPGQWDWYSFLSIMALLSLMLGVMNLLPIRWTEDTYCSSFMR